MTDDAGETASLPRPSPRQVFLGLFVLGQLAFLVLSNLLGFYKDPQGYLPADVGDVVDRVLPGYTNKGSQAWTVPDEAATALRRWTQLTGQDQHWALFAPGVYKVTGFPALVLVHESDPSAAALARSLDLLNQRTDAQYTASNRLQSLASADLEPPVIRAACHAIAPLGGVSLLDAAVLAIAAQEPSVAVAPLDIELLLSDNEPADRHHFARMGHFRLRRFECNLTLLLTQRDHETLAEAHSRWADAIREHVHTNASAIQCYLQWRLAAYRERHPDRPDPKQAILVERVFNMLPPDDESRGHWQPPRTFPIARWLPDVPCPKDCIPVERYNPVAARFEHVLK